MTLTGKQRRYLRALGHELRPAVQIGKHGLTDAVVTQVEDNLLAHELIKVKLQRGAPLKPAGCGEELAGRTGAQVAQTMGHTLLLYRPHPEDPVIRLPGETGGAA